MYDLEQLPSTEAAITKALTRLQQEGDHLLRIQQNVDDYPLLPTLVKLAVQRKISIVSLVTERGDFLHDPFFRKALTTPHSIAPLQQIIFRKTIQHEGDLTSLSLNLQNSATAIRQYQEECEIEFGLNLYLETIEPENILRLCELALQTDFFFLYLIYQFPEDSIDADQLREKLATLAAHPTVQNSKIYFKNFPFCYFPAQHFKLLYRTLTNELDIKGQIHHQDNILDQFTDADFPYQSPCLQCRRRKACYASTEIGENPQALSTLQPNRETDLVFAGGSLRPSDCVNTETRLFAPPVEQGDFFAAILEGFENILLIDGYFYGKYACTPMEVLLALKRGINLFGSSSMGAWRSLELGAYGMVGMGYVYEHFLQYEIKPYHLVAQTYDQHNQPATVPLIEIYYFLDEAEKARILTSDEVQASRESAQNIHFTQLVFPVFFRTLARERVISENTLSSLRNFYSANGSQAFEIKRLDALSLLKKYRQILESRAQNYTRETFEQWRDTILERLLKKYPSSYDRTLPNNWMGNSMALETKTPGLRGCPPEETLAKARELFHDLELIIPELTYFDDSQVYVINLIFLPFYFLGYPLSTSTGYGLSREKALVSAYMELVERIPTRMLPHIAPVGRSDIATEPILFADLPAQFELHPDLVAQINQRAPSDESYLLCTDILHSKNVYLPTEAIHLGTSNGMASGNTLLEAIVHAVLEIIERDVMRTYEHAGPEYHQAMRLDPAKIVDDASRRAMDLLDKNQFSYLLYLLENPYGIPVVQAILIDDQNSAVYMGLSAALNPQEAIASALTEAYQAYLVFYQGGRDDKVQNPPENLFSYWEWKKRHRRKIPLTDRPTFSSRQWQLSEAYDYLLQALSASGVEAIYVANIGANTTTLATVRVIIPQMLMISEGEITLIPPYLEKKTQKLIDFLHQRGIVLRLCH